MFLYFITLVTLITLCHQLACMLKFLDTLTKLLLLLLSMQVQEFALSESTLT